jgi:hypothetical protein
MFKIQIKSERRGWFTIAKAENMDNVRFVLDSLKKAYPKHEYRVLDENGGVVTIS